MRLFIKRSENFRNIVLLVSLIVMKQQPEAYFLSIYELFSQVIRKNVSVRKMDRINQTSLRAVSVVLQVHRRINAYRLASSIVREVYLI